MATPIMRSALRSMLRRGAPAAPKRPYSSSGGHQNEAAEASKWEKITILGILTCTCMSFYVLSKGHPHHEESPPYGYLHVRNKEFPWGPDGLFEAKKDH